MKYDNIFPINSPKMGLVKGTLLQVLVSAVLCGEGPGRSQAEDSEEQTELSLHHSQVLSSLTD